MKDIIKAAITTFKNKRLVSTLTINIIMTLLVIAALALFYSYIRPITIDTSEQMRFIQPEDESQYQAMQDMLNLYLARFIIGALITLFIILLVTTAATSISWNNLLKRQNSIKKYLKYLALTSSVIIIYSLLLFSFSKILLQNIAIVSAVILTILYIYYIPILNYHFFKEEKIFKAIPQSMIAFKKIALVIPILASALVYTLPLLLAYPFRFTLNIWLLVTVWIVVFNFTLSYYKTFIFESLELIEKKRGVKHR
jgi:hypothetical protein